MRLVCWAAGISLTRFPFPQPFVLPKRLRGNMRPPTPIRGRERRGDRVYSTPSPFVVRGTLFVGGGGFSLLSLPAALRPRNICAEIRPARKGSVLPKNTNG